MGADPPERTKVVVRKLPPNLLEADFKSTIDAAFSGDYNWFHYVAGKTSATSVKLSRAYLNFADPLRVYDFRSEFDGHKFVTEKGTQFSCSVEFAPYQKVPKKSRKKDPKEGTLESDQEYIDFVQNLGKEPPAPVKAEAQAAAESQPAENGKRITPLMQYLHDKWTGKLVAHPSSSRARQRSKAEASRNEHLAPPPGFAPLPTSGPESGKPARGSNGPKALHSTERAQAATNGIHGEEATIASKPPSKAGKSQQKPLKKKQSSKKGQSEPKMEAPAVASCEAPTKLLKTSPAAPEPVPEASTQEEGKPGRRGQLAAKRSAPKPVRAGFQVYTPKLRAGESGGQAEEATATDAGPAKDDASPAGAKPQGGKELRGQQSRPGPGSRAEGPPDGSKAARGNRGKQKTGGKSQADARESSATPATGEDAWGAPSAGPDWELAVGGEPPKGQWTESG